MKIPVLNSWNGVFQVDGKSSSGSGSQLQVSGADSTNTKGVSYYQNLGGETDIYGGGTLWCYNDFRMDDGLLQTKDSNTDYLKVGTSTADGTAYLLGGTVNINPGTNVYGILQILGTTASNIPILDVGSATLNFKVNTGRGSTESDQLIVGGTGGSGPGTGRVVFAYSGGTATVGISPQGTAVSPHAWQVLLFGSLEGKTDNNPTSICRRATRRVGNRITWKSTTPDPHGLSGRLAHSMTWGRCLIASSRLRNILSSFSVTLRPSRSCSALKSALSLSSPFKAPR